MSISFSILFWQRVHFLIPNASNISNWDYGKTNIYHLYLSFYYATKFISFFQSYQISLNERSPYWIQYNNENNTNDKYYHLETFYIKCAYWVAFENTNHIYMDNNQHYTPIISRTQSSLTNSKNSYVHMYNLYNLITILTLEYFNI